jgi:rsbT antagonist protein RsbS
MSQETSARVSILREGPYLVASIHTALDDTQMARFRHDLIDAIGHLRSRGVVIDVAALDVLDSFGSRTLHDIAEMARLRGARAVIVGIQPDVAFGMVRLGMGAGTIRTAMDLEEGLAILTRAPTWRPAPPVVELASGRTDAATGASTRSNTVKPAHDA